MDKIFTPEAIAFKRECIEALYNATMTVTTTEMEFNDKSYYDEEVSKVIIENEPCRVVEQGIDPVKNLPRKTDNVSSIMCAPELVIPPGSEITVSLYTNELKYFRAGESKHYSDHQTLEVYHKEEGKNLYA